LAAERLAKRRLADFFLDRQTLLSFSSLCARSNPSTHENGHDKTRVLDQASAQCFGIPGANRRALSFRWYVAILGATRSLPRLGKASVVSHFVDWILVGEFPLLLLCISSPTSSKKKDGGLSIVLGRILIAGWAFVFGAIVLLALFPKIVTRIPHPNAIRPFLILFVLVSIVYGVVWLYRQGMKRAKRNSPDGASHDYDAPR
jgi:hypothetical protein